MANENNYDVYKPEWIPEGAKDEQYPGFVMTGVNVQDAKPKAPIHKPKNYTAEELIDGIINKNRMLLSKAPDCVKWAKTLLFWQLTPVVLSPKVVFWVIKLEWKPCPNSQMLLFVHLLLVVL